MQLLFVTLMMLSASALLAEDWPEFRGPTGQGHSAAKNLPLTWSDSENVRWSVDMPGGGWSSPIVVGQRIYLTTAVPTDDDPESRSRSLRTMCRDTSSGAMIWDVEVFRQDHKTTGRIQSKNSHASPTPTFDGKHLYVHFGTRGTACLTLEGEVVWRNRELIYDPRHGSGCSPVLADKVIVMSCDGYDQAFVVALDRKTGKIRWKKERPPTDKVKLFAFCTPLVIEVDGTEQIVSPGANSVVAYAPDDGRELWIVRHPGYSVVPRPVFAHGLVFVCSSFDQSHLLAIQPNGTGDVTDTHVVWRTNKSAPHTPSLLAVGDDLYAISDRGVATCFDARTGAVHWTERVGGNYSASPIHAAGRIYLLSEDGEATVIAPGHEYVELARNQVSGRTLASYAVVESALLVRTDSRLMRIEADKSLDTTP
jgi:outer membrane protein assembly factor BamB